MQSLNKLDSATMNFKQLFSEIDENFDIIKNYLTTLGDKILTETLTGSTDKIVTFSNTYSPGKHNLLVFYNGAPQWAPDHYTERSANSILLNFDRLETDEIRVVIIRSNLIEQDMSGYLVQLTELVNSSKSALTEVRTALNKAETLSSTLTNQMTELSAMYEDIKRMYNELST